MKNDATNTMLKTLMTCIAACETCADRCLDEKNPGDLAQCIRTDRDCADICTLTARYIARDSSHLHGVLEQCISICKSCEEECSKHQMDHCQDCAKACADCHKSCAEYATAVA